MTAASAQNHQFVYHSALAPGNGYSVFGAVCGAARLRNLEQGIGGVLLFDGECFFQWVVGPAPAVQALLKAIRADARHQDITVLLNGPAPHAPQHPTWHAGFVDAGLLDRFMIRCEAAGIVDLRAMRHLFSAADLQPALPCEAPESGAA